MNVRALLNPVLDGECAPVAPSATLAAMSLMLLGVHQQDEQPSAPSSALCIAAASASEDIEATEDGLSTPLPASSATAVVSAASAMPTSTAVSSRVTAPHLSPIADKQQQQHVTPWRVAGADKDKIKHARPSLPAPAPVKRPRRACANTHTRSKIDDLFSDARSDSSKPALSSPSSSAPKKSAPAPPKTSKAASNAARKAPYKQQQQQEQPGRPNLQLQHTLLFQDCSAAAAASSPGQYCAVAGCLRIARELSKCAMHKGMKLCSAGGCFRPVQSRGFCKSHGGGARCKHPGCSKGAISKGRCRSHGGGTRCAIPSCSKWAQRFGCCVRHSKAFAATATATGPAPALTTAPSASRASVHV